MIVKKPSIFIYTHLADEAILREVCAGVEEEGVFYEITEFPDECMEKLSYKAARDSMLGSGIGIFGTDRSARSTGLALHWSSHAWKLSSPTCYFCTFLLSYW